MHWSDYLIDKIRSISCMRYVFLTSSTVQCWSTEQVFDSTSVEGASSANNTVNL